MSTSEDNRSESAWLAVGLNQKWVYIAGPVTLGNWMHNLRQAVDAGEAVSIAGFLPIIPQYTMLSEYAHPNHSYQFYLYRMTLPLIKKCDFLIRTPGESKGADAEVEYAKTIGVPVYYSVEEFLNENRRLGREGWI